MFENVTIKHESAELIILNGGRVTAIMFKYKRAWGEYCVRTMSPLGTGSAEFYPDRNSAREAMIAKAICTALDDQDNSIRSTDYMYYEDCLLVYTNYGSIKIPCEVIEDEGLSYVIEFIIEEVS